MKGRPYINEELALIKQLRFTHRSVEIVEILKLRFPPGRTKCAVDYIITAARREGTVFPKIRHGNLKWDKNKALELRRKIKSGLTYRKIKEIDGIDPAIISRTLAREIRGELNW